MSDLRSHWSLDEETVFLNHGAFGACPRSVLEFSDRIRTELERDPVRYMELVYEGELEKVRAEVARFVGARPEDLVFLQNTTSGVNAVLRSLEFEEGDVILSTDHAYNACKNAVEYAARRTGAEVSVVEIPLPISDPGEVVETILEAATSRTRFAMIDHVTSQTGLVLPIAEIVRTLRERGIETLVDGAHGPGMVPLSLDELGAAFYVGNFHKWACAPKGAAMLWARSDVQTDLHPLSISHGYSSTRDRARFLEEFDWTGSFDPSAIFAIPEAIRFVGGLFPGGWPEVYARNRALALHSRSLLLDALGTPPLAPESMIGSLAAVSLPDSPPGTPWLPPQLEPLHRRLYDEFRVQVPVFSWPAPPRRLLRVSSHLYNSERDCETLVRALGAALVAGGS